MKYQDLIEWVRRDAELGGTREARETVAAVLATLAHCLSPADRDRVAESLPGSLENAAEVPGPPEIRDGAGLVVEAGHRLGVGAERARYLTQAVIRALRAGDPALVDHLRSTLASDVLAVLEPTGEPPGRAESVRREVPTELSDTDVASVLRRLPEWEGDRTGISRTVRLPADRHDPLVNQVQRVAAEFNDHARVSRSGDAVTFTVSTGSGVVTEPDVRLAERIDQVVTDVGSGGRPG
ncbi:DUF2267 domain-containing protein [Saccharomonospora saliphila]|uniref:DUF2267 domain-containing protein n=1 Tax=Saccharomonospora saliphila TaxID=369829 RepID=UPI000378A46C|nr:DUF2267 domain-containing protein [Saccharomonospora saliphila]